MVTLQDGPADEMLVRFPIPPRSRIRVVQDGATALVQVNGRDTPVELLRSSAPRLTDDLALATPRSPEGLRALRGPDYPLLTHDRIMSELEPGGRLVASASDPVGDDTGTESGGAPGSFAYPRAPQFLPGSLDLTGFSLSADDSSARFVLTFAALSNPGWHPEYGFQLTYAAIAIDKDGEKGTGKQDVGWNSGFILPEGRGFERLVLVGGGVRIEDESGTPLAAYLPAPVDAAKPFGDAAKGTIGFTVPLALLGRPEPGWTLYLLVGAQDDHGGAGLGEFRQVMTGPAAEWSGGGKKQESSPNVYDMLIVRTPKNR
jgi:hypothetical protein